MSERALVSVERIARAIHKLRGYNVMLDSDLAGLYDVPVKVLNQAVKRNRARFPPDFMCRLTAQEAESLRSQIVTSKPRRGGRRTAPYAFTEQGVAMLSSVLRGSRAVRVNIEIMRAFVRLRRILAANADLAKRLDTLETKYDAHFEMVFQAIRDLMIPVQGPRKRIGFHPADAPKLAGGGESLFRVTSPVTPTPYPARVWRTYLKRRPNLPRNTSKTRRIPSGSDSPAGNWKANALKRFAPRAGKT